jgi:transposase
MRFIPDLSQETLSLLDRIYKHSQYYQVRRRAHCLILSHKGYTIPQLQTIFQVNRVTIYAWFNAWESQSLCGLYDKKGRGRPPKLNSDQQEQIRQWVKQFPKNLNQVCALVQEKYGYSVSKSTIKRVLKSLQFSWHRIRRRLRGEPDPSVYQKRKEALELLIEEDKQGIIDLRYFDESGFCLVPYIPYAWQEQGDIISIESGQSKRLNVLGFMSRHNELEAYTCECTVDSEVVIHSFHQFCETLQEPTVVVVDNASIHTSDAFQQEIPKWEKKGLWVFYLPSYSPELNLIEILWRFMKYEWIEFWAYASFSDLIQYVEGIIINFGKKYKINFA